MPNSKMIWWWSSSRMPLRAAVSLLIVLASTLMPMSVHAAAGWDCQQGKNGAWDCVAGKPKKDGTAKSAPAETPREPANAQEPAAVEHVNLPEVDAPVKTVEPETSPGPATSPAQEIQQAEQPHIEEPVEPPANPLSPEESEARHLEALRKAEAPTSEEEALDEAPKQTAEVAGKPGWNCRAGGGKEWDCSLVGPDPRGLAHRLGEAGEASDDWSAATTLTTQDELRFRNLMSKLSKDPWSLSCGWHKTQYTRPTDFLLLPEERLLRENSPMEIHSNYAELLQNEIADFKGAADLARADQKLYGDFVSHNTEAETITARGNVVYQEKGLSFASDTAFLKMKNNQGVLRNAQFVIHTVPSRGASRAIYLDDKNVTRYDTLTYTACPPGNQDWLMHASSAKMDRATGRGLARNVFLEFKKVPFLYVPVFTFPIDDRRQTGFLTPTFGNTSVSGFDLTAPYYVNLAPNYDATFTPRLLTSRGMMFRGEFRYMTDWTNGLISGEILPNDSQTNSSRGSFRVQNKSRFTDHLRAALNVNHVSDPRYLNDLGNVLNFPSNRHITSTASLIYSGRNYSIEGRGDYYETIDTTIASSNRPYRRLPAVRAKYDEAIAETGLRFNGKSEMVSFDHPDPSRVTGQRFNVRPRLYYPYRSKEGYVTPSISVDYTQYWLQWPQGQLAANPDRSNSVSRVAPIFSVDAGTFFDRDFKIGDSPMQQTLEPRLFYLYVPQVKQDQIPIFDSGAYDFNFYQLFRENRFAGGDRLADSNQFTAALTTRLVDQKSGLERLRASLGDIFYFRDQTVTLPCDQALTANQSLTDSLNNASIYSPSVDCIPPHPTRDSNGNIVPASQPLAGTRNNSNVVGEVSTQLSQDWLFRTTGQWNPQAVRIDRGQLTLQYNNKANQLVNLSYRYRRDPITGQEVVQQTDASFRLPIPSTQGWYLAGRWQYSLLNDVTAQKFLGVERETCCWRFAIFVSQYLNGASANLNSSTSTSSTSTNNTAVFVQLELKGLTRFGDQIDQFLTTNLSGFRGPNEVFGIDPYQQ